MAFLLEDRVLRTRKKKEEKKKPLTNAEKALGCVSHSVKLGIPIGHQPSKCCPHQRLLDLFVNQSLHNTKPLLSNMHPQKKKRELRLKRERYHRQKTECQLAKDVAKPLRLSRTLFRVKIL
ncbi:hypothetical protein RRG08_005646 [Elysia crispata]|uniref:Uncharacterized protein n=1 Tax=Elysia crispata TaxID=231223 RepID=A0AAE1ECQ4_9GAST|nr:hypothetical protein RRG08_005646 [Elysia crispata]